MYLIKRVGKSKKIHILACVFKSLSGKMKQKKKCT